MEAHLVELKPRQESEYGEKILLCLVMGIGTGTFFN